MIHNAGRCLPHDIMTQLISLKQVKKVTAKMAAVIGGIDFLESDEDDDFEEIATRPAILSFFNHLLTDQNDFGKSCPLPFSLTF